MVIYAYSVPAIVAFLTKIGLLIYAARSPVRDARTRLFVAAVLVSLCMNILEISGLQKVFSAPEHYRVVGYVFNGAMLLLFTFLFHLAASIAFEQPSSWLRYVIRFAYTYVFFLWVLLALTKLIIVDFVWVADYTIIRTPGPLYVLFEIYLVTMLLTILLFPLWSAVKSNNGRVRSRCQIWMLAATPACMVVIMVLALLRSGISWINTTVTLPIPMALLLTAIGYSVYNTRIVEPFRYLSFSKSARQKTALYARLAEVKETSLEQHNIVALLKMLSDALRCPAWLITQTGKTYSTGGETPNLPNDLLTELDGLVTANEVDSSMAALMKTRGIGAVTSLFPSSHLVRAWLVFGESFSSEIYTPSDFKKVEATIRGLAGLFLDHMLDASVANPTLPPKTKPTLVEQLASYEAAVITETLRACNGSQAKAAKQLGLQPNTLHYKLRRLGLKQSAQGKEDE